MAAVPQRGSRKSLVLFAQVTLKETMLL